MAVETKPPDALFDEVIAGVNSPRLFLKMDTQGYDLEVVRGALGSLPRVLGLLSEIAAEPAYEGMPLYLELLEVYELPGFRLRSIIEIAWNWDDRDRQRDRVHDGTLRQVVEWPLARTFT